MQINKDKLKIFMKKNNKNYKLCKNHILAGSLAIMLLASPLFGTNAKAMDSDGSSYYQTYEENNELYLCDVKNFSSLKIKDNIETLIIRDSNISNLDLRNTNVKRIEFYNSNISSIKLPNRMTYIGLDNSKINLNLLRNDYIEELRFLNTKFNDLEEVGTLNNVSTFKFECCEIKSIKGIEKSKENIIELSFVDVGIENITQIKELKNMQLLTLYGTCVKDLSPLKGLPSLWFLDLSQSPELTSLDPVMEIPNLESIKLLNTQMALTEKSFNYIRNNLENDLRATDLQTKKQVELIAKSICKDGMSDTEKTKAIVNYVVDHLEYDDRIYDDRDLMIEYHDHALEHFIKGIGLCKNYSYAIDSLMRAAGVKGFEIRDEGHIWNLVCIENQYYWIDATWIDTIDNGSLKNSPHYMVSYNDPYFNETHVGDTKPSSLLIYLENGIPKIEYSTKPNEVYKENKENEKNTTIINTENTTITDESNIEQTTKETKELINNIIEKEEQKGTSKAGIAAITIAILASLGVAIPVTVKKKKDSKEIDVEKSFKILKK